MVNRTSNLAHNTPDATAIDQELNRQLGRPVKPSQKVEAFSGQQDGERVLHKFGAHPMAFWTDLIPYLITYALLGTLCWFVADWFPDYTNLIKLVALATCVVLSGVTMWWLARYYRLVQVILTERRIVRFEPQFPFFTRKRMLFWTNVLKTKAMSKNVFLRFFKVGELIISPVTGEDEDIKIDYVYYYDDLANYIDKILFLAKHTPAELYTLNEFVLKPKGKRY